MYSSPQLSRVALMEQFVWLMDQFIWLMDQLRVLAEWRSVSMESGEQCVIDAGVQIITGITILPELFADKWGTMSTLEEVS